MLTPLLYIITQLIIYIPRTHARRAHSARNGQLVNDPSAAAGLEILIRNDNNKDELLGYSGQSSVARGGVPYN